MTALGEWLKGLWEGFTAHLRRQWPYLILSAFLAAMFLTFFFDRIVISIHPGERGVLWRRLGGGTQIDYVYPEGLHLILPINEMTLYTLRKQLLTDTIDVLTVDGLTVQVRYSARYFLDKDTLPLLHQRVGPNYMEVIVRPEVRAVMRTVFGQYKPEEIYTSQKAIQERVNVLSKMQLEQRFVALDAVPIESITLPGAISTAIESKMAQQQLDGEYLYRMAIATKEANRKRVEAGGIKAYNDTIRAGLTPEILTWHGIQATQELARSPNAKVVVFGSGKNSLPLLLGKD